MGLLFKQYKTKFRYALKPIFAMLVSKYKESEDKNEWYRQVETVRQSVLQNPVDYLGTDLPDIGLLEDVVDEIFFDFFKDLKIKKIS